MEKQFTYRGHVLPATTASEWIAARVKRDLTHEEIVGIVEYCRSGPNRTSMSPLVLRVNRWMAHFLIQLVPVVTKETISTPEGPHAA